MPSSSSEMQAKARVDAEMIQRAVLRIRGQNVMLDSDLATLYRVDVKVLNQAVKRNRQRFPPDFMFQMNAREAAPLRSQIVTANPASDAAIRVHRTGRGHVIERVTKPAGRPRQHRNHARVRAAAPHARRKRRTGQKARRARAEVRWSVPGCVSGHPRTDDAFSSTTAYDRLSERRRMIPLQPLMAIRWALG